MKTLITSIFVASLLMGTNAIAQDSNTANLQSEFKRLLDQEIVLGDADALRIQKRARDNGGRLKITRKRMETLVAKWNKTSYRVRYTRLYKINKSEGDVDALRLAKMEKESNGKYRMTAAEMIKLVKKWEAIDAKSEL